MKATERVCRSLARRILGRDRGRRIVTRLASLLDLDLLEIGYRNAGILNYETSERTGEQWLLEKFLPEAITAPSPVMIDVGANRGEMTLGLVRSFPSGRVLAFEPNPVTFDALQKNTSGLAVECVQRALGSQSGSTTLYSYRNDPASGHATTYREMFHLYENYGVPAARDLLEFGVEVSTLDDECRTRGIERADFLKIDVEGHELAVLRGATELVARGIAVIQFEFADCNVFSRTFMRDYYEQLPGYEFFRLAPKGLIPLGTYAARLEIFQFQNIVAVQRNLENRSWRRHIAPQIT